MVSIQPAIIVTFVAYLLLMFGIGWFAWRQTHDLADYILGGRRLGVWVAALSAGASDMSGWLLLGLPGYAYSAGLEASWLALGLLVGTYLNWRIVARRLRAYSEAADNALTLPEFFEQRFADRTRLLRIISALFILLFFLFYTSAGLVAGGKLFETVFGMPYQYAVVAGAAAVLLYTFFGGFLAVSWTDVAQGLLMLAALIVVPLAAIWALGGWQSMLDDVRSHNPTALSVLLDAEGRPLTLIAIGSLLGWGLGYFGQPHILARFKAIRSPAQVPAARRIAVTWTALTLIGATLVGLVGSAYLNEPLHGAETETVFMVLVSLLFHPLVAGILLAAILAAIMSTADSQLLVASSALAEDFYKALFRRQAGQRELIGVGRAAVVLIAVAATWLALDPDSQVLELVAYAWAGFGAAFGPALLFALYWSRMNVAGALAGIVVGGVTVIVWRGLEGGLFELYELIPGFVLSSLAIVAVTLLTPQPGRLLMARHFAVARRAHQEARTRL